MMSSVLQLTFWLNLAIIKWALCSDQRMGQAACSMHLHTAGSALQAFTSPQAIPAACIRMTELMAGGSKAEAQDRRHAC